MAFGLITYNDTARREDMSDIISSRELAIKISKAENGYIFTLTGSREVLKPKGDDYYNKWAGFEAKFVYQDLETGMKEAEGFFKLIEESLAKKVAMKTKK